MAKKSVQKVSLIRGIFPKNNAEWLNWISQGKADCLNKEKIQTLINQQRINLAEVEYLDLDSVAKVVKEFENPSIEEEKSGIREHTRSSYQVLKYMKNLTENRIIPITLRGTADFDEIVVAKLRYVFINQENLKKILIKL